MDPAVAEDGAAVQPVVEQASDLDHAAAVLRQHVAADVVHPFSSRIPVRSVRGGADQAAKTAAVRQHVAHLDGVAVATEP